MKEQRQAPAAHTAPSVAAAWQHLVDDVAAALHALAAQPKRSIVLLPYLQLIPLAQRYWAARHGSAPAPRFETTRSWAAQLGPLTTSPTDLSFNHGRDVLVARSLLEGAGLAAHAVRLAPTLVQQTLSLAPMAAAMPPALRPGWAEHAKAALPAANDDMLALEAVLARIAVAWAAGSDYATDVLFAAAAVEALDALIVVAGLRADPLLDVLSQRHVEKVWPLRFADIDAPAKLALHACLDAEDEAERAAACVLRHLQASRAPVALVAGDRVLTRRVVALLAARGVRSGATLTDETGWKLSTTHPAAVLLAALRACLPHASTDEVLAWLKLAPAVAEGERRALERLLRRKSVRDWAQAQRVAADLPPVMQIAKARAGMRNARPLAAWLAATQELLQNLGHWDAFAANTAGQQLVTTLGLDDASALAWDDVPAAMRQLTLSDFIHWCQAALEAARFAPAQAAAPQVVVLPLAQLLARPFAAVVLPGADERNLPTAPEPPGPWTRLQREHLHLPSRSDLQREQEAAWQLALHAPALDVLWRSDDGSGNRLLPSPLVQLHQLRAGLPLQAAAPDPRVLRQVPATPVARPAPSGAGLAAQPLSPSSYHKLRQCPYQFFALRLLGLQADNELDVEVQKRDWGTWVHLVLDGFHKALAAAPQASRRELIEQAAQRATDKLQLDSGEFLPFAAAWPALRDAYLEWFAGYEADGTTFVAAESSCNAEVDGLQLRGRIDRIDRAADGTPLLIDYKTEGAQKTRDRIRAGCEDTQLPFYLLLTGEEGANAAYLNLDERKTPKLHALEHPAELAARLLQGMQDDMQRVAAGAPLAALGEGSVCDWCDVRGLCRKDSWS